MRNISFLIYLFASVFLLFFTEILILDHYNEYYLILPAALIFTFFIIKKISSSEPDWLSPDVIFLLMFYLIHFSYLYLYSFDLVNYESEVFYNSEYMNITIFLCTSVLSFFLLGYSITSPKNFYLRVIVPDYNNESLFLISKIMIISCSLMFWLPILSIYNIAFSDYNALINVGSLSSIGKLYWLGQYISVPFLSIYYLIYFKNLSKNKKDFFIIFPTIYILSYLFIGDRGGFLFYIIIPLICYNYIYKKLSLKKAFLAIFLLLFASTILSVSRVSSTYNPMEAYNLYKKSEKKDSFVESISEFGQSVKTVNVAVSNIPKNYDYWYGKSYYDSLMISLPNLFSNRISQGVDTWLTETFFGKDTYGRGGSIVMESYINLGILGSNIFFLTLGMITGKIYRNFRSSKNMLYLVIYLTFMATIIIWMRNTSSYFFRTIIWSYALYILTINFIKYFPKKVKL